MCLPSDDRMWTLAAKTHASQPKAVGLGVDVGAIFCLLFCYLSPSLCQSVSKVKRLRDRSRDDSSSWTLQ